MKNSLFYCLVLFLLIGCHSEYKYAINYEHHNEDSIKLSYLDKSDKKINHEVAPYVAKYDKKNYGITIK